MPSIVKSTPNRKTRLTFLNFQQSVSEIAVFRSRYSEEIGAGSLARRTNLTYIPGIGIQLANRGFNLSEQWDQSLTNEKAGTVATGYSGIFTNIRPTLSGVTSTVTPGTQSMPMKVKKVAAGGTHALTLGSDVGSFPGPTLPTSDESANKKIVNMSRVFVSTNNHEPDEPLHFVATIPGGSAMIPSAVCTFYFCGPAGADAELNGYGQYAVVVSGNGKADLYERGTAPGSETVVWKKRFRFNLKDAGAGDLVQLVIYSDCKTDGSDYKGSKISFGTKVYQGDSSPTLNSSSVRLAIESIAPSDLNFTTYNAPGSADRAVTLTKARIDAREDMHVSFNLFEPKYATAGEFVDMAIDIGIIPGYDGPPIKVDTYFSKPSGCDITVKLIAIHPDTKAETEITGTVTITDAFGTRTSFDIPTGTVRYRSYRLKASFTGSGTKTPTFLFYVVQRDAVRQDADNSQAVEFPLRSTSGPALPRRLIRNVTVSSNLKNQEAAMATVDIADLTGEVPQIQRRTGTPLDIDILDDEGELVSRLFRGTITRMSSERMWPGLQYPKPGAWKATVSVMSEVARLNQQLAPSRISMWDTTATPVNATGVSGAPLKATDAIKTLLLAAGEPTDWVSTIPDRPVRLQGAVIEDMLIEPDAELGSIAQQIAQDYLGAYLYKDENAGTDGAWRLMEWKRPPYNIVIRFDTRLHTGGPKLRHVLGAYGSITQENDQITPIIPTFKRVTGTEPPEHNMIVVIGGARKSEGTLTASGAEQLIQVAINPKSYNALNLDPSDDGYPDVTSPDFLGRCVPIVHRDPSLSTENAVNFITRRLADVGWYARETMQFFTMVPLITDVTDTLQVRPRIPQTGDMVEVVEPDGTIRTWVIADCTVQYRKAHKMWGTYELVTSTRINELAVPNGGMNSVKFLQAMINKMLSVFGAKTTAFGIGSDAASKLQKTSWNGVPNATMASIQDLDPSSPDFGSFNYLEGYDPAP